MADRNLVTITMTRDDAEYLASFLGDARDWNTRRAGEDRAKVEKGWSGNPLWYEKRTTQCRDYLRKFRKAKDRRRTKLDFTA